jgi:hypothetical protein
MKIEVMLKYALGIVLLYFFITLGFIDYGNIYYNTIAKIPFWIVLFIFFDWRKWVNYESKQLS